MDYKELLNSVAKWGLLLGLTMTLSRIVEAKFIVSGSMSSYTFLTFEWIFAAAIYVVVLYRANKMRAQSLAAEVGYRFSQSLNYTILIAIFAAVIVGIGYHIYIVNFVGGYDVYLEKSLDSISKILAESDISSEAFAILDQSRESVEVVRENPPTIISTILSVVSTYIISGFIVGLGVAALTKRKAVIPFVNDDIDVNSNVDSKDIKETNENE